MKVKSRLYQPHLSKVLLKSRLSNPAAFPFCNCLTTLISARIGASSGIVMTGVHVVHKFVVVATMLINNKFNMHLLRHFVWQFWIFVIKPNCSADQLLLNCSLPIIFGQPFVAICYRTIAVVSVLSARGTAPPSWLFGPTFWLMSILAKWSPISATAELLLLFVIQFGKH